MYEYIDENISKLKKQTQRLFNNSRLRLLSLEKINATNAKKESDRLFKNLKKKSDAFIIGLIYFLSLHEGIQEDKYKIEELLSMYSSTLLYSFYTEFERKKARYFEAIIAIGDANDQRMIAKQKSDVRNWNIQVEEFAVDIERKILLDKIRSSGYDKVQWITHQDEKVCSDCADLNGKIFDVKNVPKRPHIGCRCILRPVPEK